MCATQNLDHPVPEKRSSKTPPVRPIFYVLLAFLPILAAAVAVPLFYRGQRGPTEHSGTRLSMGMIRQALATFCIQHGRYPTTAEGLDALVHQPPGVSDWHPFLEKSPLDPWNQPFVYRSPSTTGQPDYDLYSIGPDGVDGTADDIWDTP